MTLFGVTPQKAQALETRMVSCAIHEKDLEERFVRSSGPGGQKTNRTATCVYLKHLPTGIEVKMQQARSQALNRYYARRRLCELIEARQLGDQSASAKEYERIRKQKARRKRRTRQRRETDTENTA
jgi:peptide chain release factor